MLNLPLAFGTVNHRTLIHKLEYRFEVTGSALKWDESYHSNLSQLWLRVFNQMSIPLSVTYLRDLSLVPSSLVIHLQLVTSCTPMESTFTPNMLITPSCIFLSNLRSLRQMLLNIWGNVLVSSVPAWLSTLSSSMTEIQSL